MPKPFLMRFSATSLPGCPGFTWNRLWNEPLVTVLLLTTAILSRAS
jgi:hypothetical protein